MCAQWFYTYTSACSCLQSAYEVATKLSQICGIGVSNNEKRCVTDTSVHGTVELYT